MADDPTMDLLKREIFWLRRQLGALKIAAIMVANTRYSDAEWDELDRAIGQMIEVLCKQGVKFNNPRIN